jgi:hypothetical protein
MITNTIFQAKPVSTIEEFKEILEAQLHQYYSESFDGNLESPKIKIVSGSKYHKLIAEGETQYVWGFVSRYTDVAKGLKRGDLLKAASRNAPAKHSRGNLIDGTAKYGPYGPDYLK